MQYGDVKIKVFIKDKNNLIANANVSLNTLDFGFVTIKGFQIWRSNVFNQRLNEQINITPPTKQTFGRYTQQVFFEDKDKWYELEAKIYDVFNNDRNKKLSKQSVEDINIDDIPEDLGQ